MKKYLTIEYIKYLFEKTKKSAAFVFALVTTVFTFVSFDDLLTKWGHNTIGIKICFLASLCIVSLLVGFIVILITEDKPFVVYHKEKTNIFVEFGDMKSHIKDNTGGKSYTVVIPINTHLNVVGNKSVIKGNSMHGLWLNQMDQCHIDEKAIKEEAFNQVTPNKKGVCKIGDYCYFTNIKNVNYLLIATCDITKEKKPSCTEQQYFIGLQAMINALSGRCDIQEEIFIPVIGGGYANMERTNQELVHQMVDVLIFNSKKLQNDIHVVVYEKLKDEIQLYSLFPSKR